MPATGEALIVIGLISGGKDSFFSLLHCIANNHHIVALANLYPPEVPSTSDEPEDLNSFMYQTAGHCTIPLYSEALSLPLYRQAIRGSALDQSKNYHGVLEKYPLDDTEGLNEIIANGDETESLMPLLQKVIKSHPTANAISTGAILSTYQRTRIESIARRLGLISLSYLWQYPSLPPPSQGGLLDDMAAAGLDVRIVKVASGGLDEELLWKDLMEPSVRRKVQKAVNRFGGSVLGEGGEFETLVIDGPLPFWTARIEVNQDQRWLAKGRGGEAWMGFTGAGRLITKSRDDGFTENSKWERRVRIPGLWDIEFEKLVENITRVKSQSSLDANGHQMTNSPEGWEARIVAAKNSSMLKLHNFTDPKAEHTASEQMSNINARLPGVLMGHGVSNTANIVFTTILLRRMKDFTSVNDVYGKLFNHPNPPARVTVACGDCLPQGAHVMVSFVICLDQGLKEGLHVQSRSYWAPANIGPYSQAISVPLQIDQLNPRLTYIAGQIPLVPATMEVLQTEEAADQDGSEANMISCQKRMCLALQHVWRIGNVMNISWWTHAVAFIVGGDDVSAKALLAWEIWKEAHNPQLWEAEDQDNAEDESNDFDIWHQTHGAFGTFANNSAKGRRLPDFTRTSDIIGGEIPPFLAVQVDELPRGCDIEWQSSGLAYTDSSSSEARPLFSCLTISWDALSSDDEFCAQLDAMLHWHTGEESSHATIYTPRPDLICDIDMQVIPCRAVWGPAGSKLAAGIVFQN